MDVWSGVQIYLVISAALAGTSYINLYRPAIQLLEEILDDKAPIYSNWVGMSMWLIMSFIVAPFTAVLLLSNDNEEFIEKLAVSLADKVIKNKEDGE